MGAQVGPSLIKKDQRAPILCSLCTPKSRRPYANIHARTGNAANANQIAKVTLDDST